ncbi:MAG: serine/threonine protein kinase [Sorangium cellulosum]|nr:MAG: serine/threonine protein kinase [Sorangium cellulosum]
MTSQQARHNPSLSPLDPLEGTRYRTRSRLDYGGMGDVFLANHIELGHTVVIKLLHKRLGEDEGMVDRVRLEAQTLANLRHPNLVRVIDAGNVPDGRPFFVMERLVGHTLHKEIARRGKLPVDEALIIIRGVLRGLQAAHGLGVVHRDVKPGNIFLHETDQGTRIPKLLDFGIAKVVRKISGGPRPLAVPTVQGGIIGTPAYLAPEQVLGRNVDVQADIYAASLVLYKSIAGHGPFDHHKDDGHLAAAHVRDDPKPLSHYVDEPVPAELETLIRKGLSKNPEDRFQTAEEMIKALQGLESVIAKRRGKSNPPAVASMAHPREDARERLQDQMQAKLPCQAQPTLQVHQIALFLLFTISTAVVTSAAIMMLLQRIL